jgi:outer membrane biosynthesis protein TonB
MKAFWALGVLLAVPAGGMVEMAAAPEGAPVACVKLARSEPFPPDEAPMPKYPEEAKAAHVEGEVSLHFQVESGCVTDEIAIDDGPEVLREPVKNAVKDWKYCGVPEGQEIRAAVAFRLNCAAK